MIVNTKQEKGTPALVAELRQSLAAVAPEALVIVKELQQGMVMEAPVEVRISGEEVATLQQLGRQVEGILRDTPNTEMVHHDYFNDSYLVDVNVDNEISNRLGISNASVSRLLAGAFSGAPVSTFWEGDRAVTIMLRLDPRYRGTFDNVRDAYVTSQITHASVPLRSVATLTPQWQASRIVRRKRHPHADGARFPAPRPLRFGDSQRHRPEDPGAGATGRLPHRVRRGAHQ